MSNLPSTCPEEETFEGTETWEERTFNTFFEFEREGFKVLQNFSAEPSERRFTYPVDHFHEKSFLKCDVFAWLLGRCARRFGLFAESILLEISKNLFTCSKLCFGSNFCLKIGLHIPNFKQKSFESIVKTFRQRCQNYMPQDLFVFGEQCFSNYIPYFFGLSWKTFWLFDEVFWLVLPKLPSSSPKEIWTKKKKFKGKKLHFNFWLWVVDSQAYGRKKIRVIKTALYVSRETFRQKCCWEKIFFSSLSDVSKHYWDFWQETFDIIVNPSFYVSGRKLLGKKNSRKW